MQQLLLLLLITRNLEVRDWPRDALGVLIDIEALVDSLGNGLDFRAKVPLDIVQVEAIIPVDQVDGQTKMAVATRSTNAVKIGLGVLGEVKVDDDVHRLDIDTTGEQIGTDQVPANAIAEIVEDTVSGLLGHLGMTVKA